MSDDKARCGVKISAACNVLVLFVDLFVSACITSKFILFVVYLRLNTFDISEVEPPFTPLIKLLLCGNGCQLGALSAAQHDAFCL
jgi:hypothetical protein